MKKSKVLSIVIPVYNEEKTISLIVKRVQQVKIEGVTKRIIIVNDASTDNSEKIIKKLMKTYKNISLFKHEHNRGKGAAVRTGFKKASGDFVVIQDGDLEYNPQEFNLLIKPLLQGKAEVVYGSRVLGKIKGFNLPSHYYGNLFLSFVTRLLYHRRITDMETCYKMMRIEALEGLNLRSNKFDIEPEITAKLIKKGCIIKEVPIGYNSRSFEEGKKITWKDGLKALYILVKYRIFD